MLYLLWQCLDGRVQPVGFQTSGKSGTEDVPDAPSDGAAAEPNTQPFQLGPEADSRGRRRGPGRQGGGQGGPAKTDYVFTVLEARKVPNQLPSAARSSEATNATVAASSGAKSATRTKAATPTA